MKKQHRFHGQTIIEFGFVLIVFLILSLGFLDLGRAIFYYSTLSNAVREATRYSIVNRNLTDNEIKDKVMQYAFALENTAYPLERSKIYITYPTVINEQNITISVEAVYTFQPVTPFIASNGIDLVAQSTMRISGLMR